MKPIPVREAVDAVGGKVIQEGSVAVITGVSTDTRTIQPGDLFVALKGENFDGHDYLQQAADKGASAVMIDNLNKTLPVDVHTIVTENTLIALQDLAAWYLKLFSLPVVAVTGSTGKTTTKDMIYSVLSQKFSVLKTQGNFNNEIGLPLTLFGLEPHHEIAVLEMGMSGFGEIRRLAEIAPPKVAVITNIGVSHIEKLDTRDNIWKAKSEILEKLHGDSIVILNDDNDILHREAGQMKLGNVSYDVIRFGTGMDVEFRAQNIQTHGEGYIKYDLLLDEEIYTIKINVPGKHNVYNSLAAIAAGRAFGMDMEDIQAGLLEFVSGSMRLNIFSVESRKDIKVIDDAYNASPDSVKAALHILRDMEGSRKIAILGDMLELGDYSFSAHKETGKTAIECGVNILITRGQDSAWIGEGAMEAGMQPSNVFHSEDNEGVINWLAGNLQEGDRILVKGSRGMRMEEIVSYLKNGEGWL
jgi:UDP-N-acetylmuramoyl-tripeptide--D-alanyl-D-alanine ligase